MMSAARPGTGCAAALAGAALLAATGPLIRILVTDYRMPVLVLSAQRNLFLALLLLLALELFYPRLVEVRRGQAGRIAVVGLLLALFNLLWICAVALTGAAMATVLVSTAPVFTVLLGGRWFGEKAGPQQGAAALLALSGCLLLSGIWGGARLNPAGFACGLFAGLCFALYGLAGRSAALRGCNAWTMMLYAFAIAGGVHLVVNWTLSGLGMEGVLAGDLLTLNTRWSGWLLLILLAAGPTLAGFGLYMVSLARLPAATAATLAATEPLYTAGLAWMLLDERFTLPQAAGGALVLLAVLLVRLPEGGGQGSGRDGAGAVQPQGSFRRAAPWRPGAGAGHSRHGG